MTTFTQMVDDVLSELRGYVRDQQQSTHLASGITDAATSATVADSDVVTRGRIEIGDEILWVDSVNRGTDVLTIAPYGRGFDGTTAAAHSTNDRVLVNPSFPRVAVKRAINDTIRALPLFSVSVDTFTYTAGIHAYELDATVDSILAVTWDVIGGSERWPAVRSWKYVSNADSTAFPSGKAIEIYSGIVPGRTVRVLYRKNLATMSANSDVFTTTTGLPANCEDLVRYGALARLTMGLDVNLVNNRSIEANTLTGRVQAGQGRPISQFYYAMYQQRVNEEQARLEQDYPPVIHRTSW